MAEVRSTRAIQVLAGAAAMALLALSSAQAQPAARATPTISAAIRAAVDSPDRPAAMKARDAGRKPAEVFALAGLKPGDKVLEFGSFGFYDTTIISGVIGPNGHVWMYDLPYMRERVTAPSQAFVAAHGNAEHAVGKFDELSLPSGVDLAVFDMYYHDLRGKDVDTAKLNRAVFSALKPGGRVLVVDHRAAAGSGWRDSTTIHRIEAATIVEEMQAAGFRLAVDSALLANPADDRSKLVFEPTVRSGTDRALFVFVKPGG